MERFIKPAALKSSLEKLFSLSTMTLATSGEQGEVHAADVYFACDEHLTLYFFSSADSQHSRDIHRNPGAAATIHADGEGWRGILGLQLRGDCAEVTTPKIWEQAWKIYLEKFPFVDELEEAIKVNQLFCFVPRWIRLVDNNQGFGYKEEWQVQDALNNDEEAGRWVQIINHDREMGQVND